MKKFFIAFLCAAVAVLAGYGIKCVMTPVNSIEPEYVLQEDSVSVPTFMVYDEWVMFSRSAGTFYSSVTEGARAAKNSTVGIFFYGDVASETLQELALTDKRIKNASESTYAMQEQDSGSLENSIYRRENDIIEAAQDNDIYAISLCKDDINSLRATNAYSQSNNLPELEASRTALIGNTGLNTDDITAEISGVFTRYTDGYEGYISPDSIKDCTVEYFDSIPDGLSGVKLEEEISVGAPVCKVVNNHYWYAVMKVPSETVKNYDVGDSVRLRVKSGSSAAALGTVYAVSEEHNGSVILSVEFTQYLESAFSYRRSECDLIFDSCEGYKVPIQAIHTDSDGSQRLIGVNGSSRYDCYCDVLYTDTDEGFAIVQSTEGADHRISQMDRILVGER